MAETKNLITVKNAEGDPDTTAEIVIQNKIDFEPKVSVIIPVYNVEEYLRECLDSVVNQTLKEIEIICIDDGSTDSSLDILKEYAQKDNRITICQQENQGAGFARNNGIKIAKGEFIAFMDSDDLYPKKETLETMHKKAKENNVYICGGSLSQLKNREIISDSTKFEDGYAFKNTGVIKYKDYQFDYGYWRFIYNTNFLKENGLYFPDYLRGEDPPFFIKSMILAEKFYALVEPTYVYRVSHKTVNWTERKALDALKSLIDCLQLTKNYHLDKLHFNLVQRACNPWRINIFKNINSYNHIFFTHLLQAFDFQTILNKNSHFQLPNFYQLMSPSNKISVIVPVYNVEEYLRECLDSVINQTLKEIEIICINDGSTDNSLEILEEYAKKDDRIIVINQKNQGLSCSRNNALKIANGKYIVFLDSDDYISNDALDKIYRSMEYSNLDMLSYSGINFDDNTKEKQINNYWEFSYLPNNFNFHKFSFNECKNFAHRMAVSSCLTAYKLDFIRQKDISFPKHICFEDNFFFTKALINAKVCGIIKDKLYFRRIHKNQITSNWEKHFSDFLEIVDLTLTYLTSKKIEKNIFQRYAKKYIDVIQWQYNKFSVQGKAKYKQEIDDLIKKHQSITTKKLNPIKSYLLFPVYLIKTARMKKKIHKKICRIIRGQLSRQFENTLLLTKPQIRDFALKNSPTPDYVKKNIKKITNDIYDKFHFRKKHRILGIKFYTKNKHKELSSLLTYSIKQNDLLKQENSVLKSQIEELTNNQIELQKNFSDLSEKSLKITNLPQITDLTIIKNKYLFDSIKLPNMKNNWETIEELINTEKSIIRMGNGEYNIIEGGKAVFQKENSFIAEKLKEILLIDDDNLLVGIPEPYYTYPTTLSETSKRFISNWLPKWHEIIMKYNNPNKTYYSTFISQTFPVFASYNFEEHYSKLKKIWDNKDITIITGDRVFNKIDYNIFENAKSIDYIYGPTVDAFNEYDSLKEKISKTYKNRILIFALGPCGKILAYDMYKQGYRVLDLGHLIKDYDFYKKSISMTKQEFSNARKTFFGKD